MAYLIAENGTLLECPWRCFPYYKPFQMRYFIFVACCSSASAQLPVWYWHWAAGIKGAKFLPSAVQYMRKVRYEAAGWTQCFVLISVLNWLDDRKVIWSLTLKAFFFNKWMRTKWKLA